MRFCKKCNTETERKKNGACKPCANEYNSAWRAANPDKVAASEALKRLKNPEKTKQRIAAWKAANPESRRLYRNNRRSRKCDAGGTHTSGDIRKLMTLQKGKCACCRTGIKDGYHVDHIMPLALEGSNDKLNLQLLCPTCNMQKHAKHPVDFMQQRGFLL